MDWQEQKNILTKSFGEVTILTNEDSGEISAYIPNLFHVNKSAKPGAGNYTPHHILGSSLTVAQAVTDLFDQVTKPEQGMALMHKTHDNPNLYSYDRKKQEFSLTRSL